MAITPLSADAEIKRVTVEYDPEVGTYKVTYGSKLWAGRETIPHVVDQTADNDAMLVSDAFHNDFVDMINIAATAFNV